jgi:hypothetical protein
MAALTPDGIGRITGQRKGEPLMPSSLLLSRPGSEKPPITVAQLLALLDTDHLDAQELRVRRMRESFQCPATVQDHSEFRDWLFALYAHHSKCFYGGPGAPHEYPELVWGHLRRLYQKDFNVAERNAILGRDGGLIRVIDDLTDGMVKEQIDTYIDLIFFDYLSRDLDDKVVLAQELLTHYGNILFPNEKLKHRLLLAVDIETFLKQFATHMHAMRKDWRL